MTEFLTDSVQDYLKTIYALTSEGSEASTTALAARLGVAPASVTGMLQKLASLQPPLVRYQKHQGATLTPQGEKAALEVIRHHRLIETYLVEQLGYSWDAVHEEACRMEHAISEEFEARIDASLGHPVRDPHGAPIPSADLVMPPTHEVTLSNLRGGEKVILRHVRCEDAALLHHLEDLGLIPGAEITIRAHSPFDNNLTLALPGRTEFVVGKTITDQLFVELIQELS